METYKRFANTDYALLAALKPYERLTRIMVGYDIACAYCKNILRRFRDNFSDGNQDLLDIIVWLVPKMHVLGHKDFCRLFHSYNYTSGCGRTDGEGAERVWSEDIDNAKSTREMSNGHRHDALNDQHMAMNFTKLVGLGKHPCCI